MARQEIKCISCYHSGHIYAATQFPFLAAVPLLCKKERCLESDGRQEIKYNATKSRTWKEEVLAQRLRLIQVNSQQSYEVQGSTRFSTPVTRKSETTARRDLSPLTNARRGSGVCNGKRKTERKSKRTSRTDYGVRVRRPIITPIRPLNTKEN